MRKQILLLLALLVAVFPAAAQEATPETEYLDPADLADENGHFVEINDAQVYYVEAGPADGQTVMLLHGFLGSTLDWSLTIPALAEAGYHVIAFDRPPFGLSDKSTTLDYSINGQGDLTVGLMDALEIDSAVLIGHSAGGPVVANVALRYPERVEKLVLVAAAIGLGSGDLSDTEESSPVSDAFTMMANLDPENPLARALIRGFFSSDFASSMLDSAYADTSNLDMDQMAQKMRGTRIENWEGGLLAFTKAIATDTDPLAPESLADVAIPTLIMWGEEDEIVPIEIGERLRDILPNNIWLTYPEIGHIPQEEQADIFNADLLEFLAE